MFLRRRNAEMDESQKALEEANAHLRRVQSRHEEVSETVSALRSLRYLITEYMLSLHMVRH